MILLHSTNSEQKTMNIQMTIIFLPLVYGYILKSDRHLAYGSERRILQTMKDGSNVNLRFDNLEQFLGTLSFNMNNLIKNHKKPRVNTVPHRDSPLHKLTQYEHIRNLLER